MDFVEVPECVYEGKMYDFIFVIVCRLTGYILVIPLSKKGSSAEVCGKLFVRHGWHFMGVPKMITTDQDPRFVSVFFRTLCSMVGAKQVFSRVYRADGNGRAEQAVRDVVGSLRVILLEKDLVAENWMEVLPHAIHALNSSPWVVTGMSPHEVVFGRPLFGFGDQRPLTSYTDSVSLSASDWVHRQTGLWQKVRNTLEQIHKQQDKDRNNRRRELDKGYEVEDLVM